MATSVHAWGTNNTKETHTICNCARPPITRERVEEWQQSEIRPSNHSQHKPRHTKTGQTASNWQSRKVHEPKTFCQSLTLLTCYMPSLMLLTSYMPSLVLDLFLFSLFALTTNRACKLPVCSIELCGRQLHMLGGG